MKKVFALVVMIAIVASFFMLPSFAEGRACCDYVWLYDENLEKVQDFGATARELDNLSTYVSAGARYIHLQGWYSDDDPVVDMGYCVDDGDVIWGFGVVDEALIKNKAATLHEYPLRYKLDVPITEGEDQTIYLYYKLEDGTEDIVPGGFEFTFSNVSVGNRFVNISASTMKCIEGDIAPDNVTIAVTDAENKGGDWLEVLNLDDEPTGWKATIGDASTVPFNAATFKTEGASDLEPGRYYLVLFDGETKKSVFSAEFTLGEEMGAVTHFDGVEILNADTEFTANDRALDDISEYAEAGATEIHVFGWHADDMRPIQVGYRYDDGTEAFYDGRDRSDGASAAKTLFGVDLSINVPILTGDRSFEILVKFADGYEESVAEFFYTNGQGSSENTGEPKATDEPIATDEPKATDEPIATDEPKATDEPTATDAPKATDAPAEPTDKPADGEKKGCGSALVSGFACLTLAAAAVIVRKKH